MMPPSGNRAIRPRLALAKSVLSDHGSEAVEFLLNSNVDGDAGFESPAVCACAMVAASVKVNPAAARRSKHRGRASSSGGRLEGVVPVNVLSHVTQ
ncbi:hypothetical protein [Bradyrhizobium lablabi]|uniref:hypothetical protein n=1 Tax=Bradyrhizobium lablabi TaxID=722472 RepID=UPI002012068C|nr:hypothetical protein [Bradyrhizobium lablabi]